MMKSQRRILVSFQNPSPRKIRTHEGIRGFPAACENGHLFCKTCAINNASHCIGDQKYVSPPLDLNPIRRFLRYEGLPQDLKCMAGCGASFDPKKYEEWLPSKSREALEKLQAEKELEMAFEGVEGFEKCPYVFTSPLQSSMFSACD